MAISDGRPELAKPEILAPAGDRDCFLAALAAGADAIYLGLKHFSARMEAENFGLEQLSRLVELARQHKCRVYVAMNTIVKPEEADSAYRLVRRLANGGIADGLIVQDPGMLDLAGQAGFKGMLALSTLANVTSPAGLREAKALGATRVILPRELSIDEIRIMGDACPEGLGLECFVHGALCYCVSGRCYWSSYMGGKSGLRGRCVQPCRRLYTRMTPGKKTKTQAEGGGERFFSCQDLELCEIARILLPIPNLVSWKIEGRKKGPHYVYHVVTAYRMVRDEPDNPAIRKAALEILQMALGRPGVKANFLPQRKHPPMAPQKQTSSGLLIGKTRSQANGVCMVRPRIDLCAKDYLRIGVEDERWHATVPVNRNAPKGGNLPLRLPRHKMPPTGTPVYLVDRRQPELSRLLAELSVQLENIPGQIIKNVDEAPEMPARAKSARLPDLCLGCAHLRQAGVRIMRAEWLYARKTDMSGPAKISWWLPPVIWPDNEPAFRQVIESLWKRGARHFVCNAPWQRAFFPDRLPHDAALIAGPFCNLSNAFAIQIMAKAGFMAAFASPELNGNDLVTLASQSPLPLGLVLRGNWPVGISRFGLNGIEPNEVFTSPMGEKFWARNHGGDIWIYPAWPLDLVEKKKILVESGYSFFAIMEEKTPKGLEIPRRQGLFNWNGKLL